ncbi:hypothetical protein ACIP79_02250 [Streptomyces sp. NPDC088747]|uniref:hypothetical protein n=1 Tax=Streptomyces sp. NPDC088747 TaxID=3365886 RepID=UPI0038096399
MCRAQGAPPRRPPRGEPAAGRRRTAPKAVCAECAECEKPFPGTVPPGGVCKSCQEAPAAALAAQWEREDRERQEAEALEQEAQRRRARRAAEAAAAAAPLIEDVGPDAAAEDARLRAELLAANPWMADYAPDPVPASRRPAPF